MAVKLPRQLASVVEKLSRLPGIGPVSAMRIAMRLLAWPKAEAEALGHAIVALREELCICSRCGGVADSDPCIICGDQQREQHVLCIVPEWDSVLALEAGGFYNGLYFVLGGLISATRKTGSGDLAIDKLEERLGKESIEEIVLALGSTLDAENTATYLKNLFADRFPDLRITRLAQGMPPGAEVKFMDRETLRQSMQNRQIL